MEIKDKLKVAREAQIFLNRAIHALESGYVPSSPDYDLKQAFKNLKKIQDMEDSKEIRLFKINKREVPDESTGFSLFGIL